MPPARGARDRRRPVRPRPPAPAGQPRARPTLLHPGAPRRRRWPAERWAPSPAPGRRRWWSPARRPRAARRAVARAAGAEGSPAPTSARSPRSSPAPAHRVRRHRRRPSRDCAAHPLGRAVRPDRARALGPAGDRPWHRVLWPAARRRPARRCDRPRPARPPTPSRPGGDRLSACSESTPSSTTRPRRSSSTEHRRGRRGGALQPPQARQDARAVLDVGAAGAGDRLVPGARRPAPGRPRRGRLLL